MAGYSADLTLRHCHRTSVLKGSRFAEQLDRQAASRQRDVHLRIYTGAS
jgi:hypothetical protein